jgi:hypothetical protein
MEKSGAIKAWTLNNLDSTQFSYLQGAHNNAIYVELFHFMEQDLLKKLAVNQVVRYFPPSKEPEG